MEALNTPTIRRLTPSCRHQLSALARRRRTHPCQNDYFKNCTAVTNELMEPLYPSALQLESLELLTITLTGTNPQLNECFQSNGVAVPGWGGLAAFFAHPALMAIATSCSARLAATAGGLSSSGCSALNFTRDCGRAFEHQPKSPRTCAFNAALCSHSDNAVLSSCAARDGAIGPRLGNIGPSSRRSFVGCI